MIEIFGLQRDPRPKPSPTALAVHKLIVHIDRQGWQDPVLAGLVNDCRKALEAERGQ